MAMMRVARMHAVGGPEALRVEEVPIPEPAEDQVLLEVRAASINPIDYKVRSGRYPGAAEGLPRVLGRDVAGVIAASGSGVRQPVVGDAVFAMLPRDWGGYAEYVTLAASLCAPKPGRIDFIHAAAVPLAGLTAWQGLFDHGRLEAGKTVLITGAAGGVGHLAVQFAKARGATVYATVAAEDLGFIRELGADRAIDHVKQRVDEAFDEVDLVLDLIGGETQERSWAVVKRGGTMVSVLSAPSEERARTLDARAKVFMAQPNVEELREIGRLIDTGTVRPYVLATFPLTEAASAHERAEKTHTRGKIVLVTK